MKRPTKRSRTRSGCLTCRDRHMKCDEQLPVCQNCIKSQRKCYRGIRLNFTQYSFYDPGVRAAPSVPYRVLDQSITIANLYQDSSSYRRYLRLHSVQDLRESDEVFRNDCEMGFGSITTPTEGAVDDHSSQTRYWRASVLGAGPKQSGSDQCGNLEPRSSVSLGPPHVGAAVTMAAHASHSDFNQSAGGAVPNLPTIQPQSMASMDMNVVQPQFYHPIDAQTTPAGSFYHDLIKNFNISDTFNPNVNVQNFLSTNRLDQNPNLTFSSSTIPIDNPDFEFDVFQFINLIQSEQYYWLLDLLNEVDIWKSIVPSYSINLVNHKTEIDYIDNKFLISCLLTASNSEFDADNVAALIGLQSGYFNMIRNLDVNPETYPIYEVILMSIVLMLLHFLNLMTLNKPIINCDFFLSKLLLLYNKIAYKFHKLPPAVSRRMSSLFLASSFHSIVLLKFLIHRYTGPNNSESAAMETEEWVEDFDEPVTDKSVPAVPDLRLNFFEVTQLSSYFRDYEFPQTNLIIDTRASSNAYQLRRLMWSTIMTEYAKTQTNVAFTIDRDIPKFIVPQQYVTVTNDRLGLIVMLSNYLDCARSFPIDAMSNYEFRGKWKQYFNWLFK